MKNYLDKILRQGQLCPVSKQWTVNSEPDSWRRQNLLKVNNGNNSKHWQPTTIIIITKSDQIQEPNIEYTVYDSEVEKYRIKTTHHTWYRRIPCLIIIERRHFGLILKERMENDGYKWRKKPNIIWSNLFSYLYLLESFDEYDKLI